MRPSFVIFNGYCKAPGIFCLVYVSHRHFITYYIIAGINNLVGIYEVMNGYVACALSKSARTENIFLCMRIESIQLPIFMRHGS